MSSLEDSLKATIEHYDALLKVKHQEGMKLDSNCQLANRSSDLTGLVDLEEKVELVLLKDKDERIEELEKSVDELQKENEDC